MAEVSGQRDVRGNGKIYNRYTCILAEGDTETFSLIDIFQDIGKLIMCHGICLGIGCLPDHTKYIRRQADDGFAVRPEGGISERTMDRVSIRCFHKYTLRRAV
jgi:hypothetical protein